MSKSIAARPDDRDHRLSAVGLDRGLVDLS
jgi:hypothetical protein